MLVCIHVYESMNGGVKGEWRSEASTAHTVIYTQFIIDFIISSSSVKVKWCTWKWTCTHMCTWVKVKWINDDESELSNYAHVHTRTHTHLHSINMCMTNEHSECEYECEYMHICMHEWVCTWRWIEMKRNDENNSDVHRSPTHIHTITCTHTRLRMVTCTHAHGGEDVHAYTCIHASMSVNGVKTWKWEKRMKTYLIDDE